MSDEPNKDRPAPGGIGSGGTKSGEAGGQASEPPATPSLGQEHEPQGTGGKRPATEGTATERADDKAADDRAGQTREPGYDEA